MKCKLILTSMVCLLSSLLVAADWKEWQNIIDFKNSLEKEMEWEKRAELLKNELTNKNLIFLAHEASIHENNHDIHNFLRWIQTEIESHQSQSPLYISKDFLFDRLNELNFKKLPVPDVEFTLGDITIKIDDNFLVSYWLELGATLKKDIAAKLKNYDKTTTLPFIHEGAIFQLLKDEKNRRALLNLKIATKNTPFVNDIKNKIGKIHQVSFGEFLLLRWFTFPSITVKNLSFFAHDVPLSNTIYNMLIRIRPPIKAYIKVDQKYTKEEIFDILKKVESDEKTFALDQLAQSLKDFSD